MLLHPITLATVMAEYRNLYREAMPDPYFLLGVLIEEAGEVRVPENRVLALLGDERVGRPTMPTGKEVGLTDDGRDVFRCGRCGRIVNEYGEVLEGEKHSYSITLLRTRGAAGTRHVEGECCQNL